MTTPAGHNPQPNAAPPAAAPRKTRRLGDYELLGKLGHGAMGSVYLARNVTDNRQVALKILPQELARDEEFLERFRREARAASRLTHPNIVAAYDVGVADNYHYIAMEYVDGPNLELYMQKRGRLNENQLLKVALDMSYALEAAGAAGIVHRDIKPANILMSSQHVAKLTDLGLASASHGDRRVTMAGFCVGTPYYIAPEQARGDRGVDGRADIYSLGATLYHLATGTLPFSGENPVVIMTKHLNETPAAPHVRQPAIPLYVSALIQKMMAKNPADRPQNAGELRADIERCIRGEMPLPKAAAAKAAPAPVAPAAPARAAPSLALLDTVLASLDRLLPFVPKLFRLPVAAVGATIGLLVVLWLLVALLRH
ncbi:MAG: serine/threonine-protein kinase [Planctomycetota bacterium]|nr:serine/threonine-protein kinase [Planctomycetota bacterium]